MVIETRNVALASIAISPERLRALRPEVVEQLADSIREQGLLQPVLLRPNGNERYSLIAGWHRLEACKKLGHKAIRAEIHDGLAAAEAELAEVDENLMRANLSPAEEALHIGARKAIYERLHPETKQGGAPGRPGGGKKAKDLKTRSFVGDTAAKSGKGRSTVARGATRAKAIAPAILKAVVGTAVDKREELDALAKLPQEQQKAIVARAKKGEKVSVKQEAKKARRAEREQELASKQLAAPKTKFGVMSEDLEWDFEVWSRETGMDRHAANHYAVAEKAHTVEELHRRTADRFGCAAEDCVLFMWTDGADAESRPRPDGAAWLPVCLGLRVGQGQGRYRLLEPQQARTSPDRRQGQHPGPGSGHPMGIADHGPRSAGIPPSRPRSWR